MKKILCLVLTAVMLFSVVGTASAAGIEVSAERPAAVSDVIDPIYSDANTAFANSINELGYAGVNKNTNKIVPDSPFISDHKLGANEITFSNFLANNADDKMFGVSYDFLYSKDSSTFLWNYLDYKLQPDLDTAVYSILGDKVNEFRNEWAKLNLGRDYTMHDAEMYYAKINGRSTSCTCKTRYDACAAVLAGYDYAYKNKEADQTLFAGIVESKVYIVNPFTKKEETHYEYAYKLEKGDFGLMRANSNNQLVKVIRTIWGDGAIYSSPKIATQNALKLTNFIGKLMNEEFDEIDSKDYKPFANKVRVTRDEFFEEVAVSSGLADLLQAKWCNAKGFDVKRIMSALGVNVDSETILDSEITKGNKMGARILADMYTDFFADPVGYVTRLVQIFCKNYDTYYAKAIKELFSVKFRYMMELSTKSNSDNLPSYTGLELDSVDGLMGFLADCVYIMDGNLNEARFTFAPLPAKRFAAAKDTNELYVYVLCYLELNRVYNDNAVMIKNFINNSIAKFEELYFPADSEKRLEDIEAVKIVFNSMFNGELTLAEIFTIHVGLFSANTIENVSTNFMSTIKKAIANFFQNFLTAIDRIMNSLFGWLG